MKNLLAFLLAFSLVVALGAGVFVLTQEPAHASPGGAQSVFPATPPAEQQFTLTMLMFGQEEEVHRWVPGTLFARVGDNITLRVKNEDRDCAEEGYPHGFALPAFGIDVPEVPGGEELTFTFTTDQPGIFDFKCANSDCGEDHDRQTGQLVVLP